MENTTNAEAMQKPLLTFAIVAYNQQDYIREAIEAAFAQTYSPLQIILSDDCSQDRTFEIMQELAAAYTGPHRLCLNRNRANQHIGGHINAVMSLAEGELVVIAAGDDISASNRVQKTFEVWDNSGRPEYCSILSGVEEFSDGCASTYTPAKIQRSGRYAPYLFDDAYVYNGSSHAWTARTFQLFGDFPAGLVNEDTALIVRNTVAGQLLLVDEPLVKHRHHGQNTGAAGWAEAMSAKDVVRYFSHFLKKREVVARCFAADFDTARKRQLPNMQRFGVERFRYAQRRLAKEQKLCAAGQRLMAGNMLKRAVLLAKCLPGTTATARFLRKSWLQVLSPSLYVQLRAWVRRR